MAVNFTHTIALSEGPLSITDTLQYRWLGHESNIALDLCCNAEM